MADTNNTTLEKLNINESIENTKTEKEFVPIKVRGGKCYSFFERAFDIIASFFALLIPSQLFLILWLLVKCTSKEPGIYISTRIAKNDEKFKFYKFRSMAANIEKIKKNLLDQNKMKDGVYSKMNDDLRITKVGKFLKKISLHELPQLWSFFLGSTSLVGPRAYLEEEFSQITEVQKQRFLDSTGVTGEWQVRVRLTSSSFEEVAKFDLEYLQRRGFWNDIKLCFMTVGVVLKQKGAE